MTKKDNQVKHHVDCLEYQPNKLVCQCVADRLREKDLMIEAVRQEAFYELEQLGARTLGFDYKHYFDGRAHLRMRDLEREAKG